MHRYSESGWSSLNLMPCLHIPRADRPPGDFFQQNQGTNVIQYDPCRDVMILIFTVWMYDINKYFKIFHVFIGVRPQLKGVSWTIATARRPNMNKLKILVSSTSNLTNNSLLFAAKKRHRKLTSDLLSGISNLVQYQNWVVKIRSFIDVVVATPLET